MSKPRAADDIDTIWARLQELRRERGSVEEEKAKAAQATAIAELTDNETGKNTCSRLAADLPQVRVAEIYAMGSPGWYFEFRSGYFGPFSNGVVAALVGEMVRGGWIAIEDVQPVLMERPT